MRQLFAFLFLLWKSATATGDDPLLPRRGGCIYFTGWKACQVNDGLAGQWIYYPAKKTDDVLYVSVPAMTKGKARRHGTFDVGQDSLALIDRDFDFRKATADGLVLLIDLIAETYPGSNDISIAVYRKGSYA